MKKNILLVEDETILREMLDESLTGKGYEVTAVGSVASALNKLDANDFDAIVTDIKLPEVTGIEFLHSLQEKTPETPVIIMTGYPSMGIAMEALKNGASDFLPKPFRAEVLDSSIQKAIKVNKLQRDNLVGLASKDESQLSKIVCSRLENKIKELSLISTVNDALYSIRDKEVLFDTLMELSFVITDFDNAFIMVVDRESGRVIVRNDTFENTLVGKKFSTNEEPFCSLLKDGKVFYEKVYDGILLPLTDSDKELEEGVPVFMCPVALGDNALIILGVSGASNGQAIGEEENSAMRNLSIKASLKLESLSIRESAFTNILSTVETLVETIGIRDSYTKEHSKRVTEYSIKLAKAYGAPLNVIQSISFAGPLHDIGNIGISDEILLKEGKYTKEEWENMQSHVSRGEEILRPLNLHLDEKAVVLYHHEMWDGSGYPNCLEGEDIPLSARIVAVMDAFDAMTTERPYRKTLSVEEAKKEIFSCSGTQFDPAVVEAFMKMNLTLIDSVSVGHKLAG